MAVFSLPGDLSAHDGGNVKIPVALQVTFVALCFLFFLLAWGQHNETVHKLAGYEGLFTAGCALYTSAALIINETWDRKVLPLGVVQPRIALAGQS
jgi:succinate-acetate transporter protein